MTTETSALLVPSTAGMLEPSQTTAGATHSVETELVGRRVRGWMQSKFGVNPWWMCGLSSEGKYLTASNVDGWHWLNLHAQMEYAKALCRHINKYAAYDGTWLVGWIAPMKEGERENLYMLWKDKDGDINIPISNSLGWYQIASWSMTDHEEHCHQAHEAWVAWHKNMSLKPDQYAKLAQGERIDDVAHYLRSRAVGLM